MPAKNRGKFGRAFSEFLRRKKNSRPRAGVCSAGLQGTESSELCNWRGGQDLHRFRKVYGYCLGSVSILCSQHSGREGNCTNLYDHLPRGFDARFLRGCMYISVWEQWTRMLMWPASSHARSQVRIRGLRIIVPLPHRIIETGWLRVLQIGRLPFQSIERFHAACR
jgi:hypothetical protein